MALVYQVFKPKKCEDDAQWKVELLVQRDILAKLEKGGAARFDELQLFLSDLAWAVARGDLSAKCATDVVSGTAISSKEPLQRVFADVLWMVGFASTEAPAKRELREEYNLFLAMLEQREVLPQRLMALSLETEVVPPAVCSVQALKKKHNQAKTKARYTITRFNLMREHSEGYARLLCLLERLASCEFAPAATAEQAAETEKVCADDVVRLVGFGHLCPNRTVAMALDVYETRLLERGNSVLLQPMLGLLRRFPLKRLTEVAVFMLLAHTPAPVAGKPTPLVEPPSKPSQLLAVASLIQAGLIDLDVLWTYLDPADVVLKQASDDMMAKYNEEVASIGKVDIGGGGSVNKNFDRALQSFNRLGHQKLRLAAALVSMNCWSAAHRSLQHLEGLCKPSLNHSVRSALCDLLKWLVSPYLQKSGVSKVALGAQAGVETTFTCTRRFESGLEMLASAAKDGAHHAAEGNGNGHAATPLALEPSDDFEILLPRIRLVLDHLEYFLHTDVHLLTMLWRVVLQHCRELSAKEGGQVVLDDTLVALIYKHLLPAACMVPSNPFLSDLMWSVVKQLSSYQRYLIYSCWETMYDSFLLKLVFARTKGSTKQILKRVVSNADRRDLIAHQSHFHICKLCHSNPIPCLETMLRDLEIGFNVNMIQPYVECTNRCPEMTADIMGYLLARTCAKPAGPDRVFLSQADATVAAWLQNLGEFCGRFFKKHPQTDLMGLLTVITKRLNGDEGSKHGTLQEFKGESLIRLVLESLMEQMGGLQTVADMTPEQLICLAGGPRLRSESVSIGKKDETSRRDRARLALLGALTEQGLVPVLWCSLSQQRHHFLSEEFAEAHSGGGGLKLLSLLFDGNHQCFLQLTEFLSQACTRDQYASLTPPTREVFSMFEPNLAFLAMRHGLPSYGKAMGQAKAAASKEGEAANAAPLKIQESPAVAELERTVRLFLPANFEEEGLSVNFYLTFWRLSLQDIFTPTEGYERCEVSLHSEIKVVEKQRREMERERDHDHKREYKNTKKEVARLQDTIAKLKEERVHHSLNHKQVQARLEQEKIGWFLKPSPHATAAFVADMICPRVLTSHSDALFCCHFVRMLIKLKTPGFQFLDFYNSWTIMLTQTIRCCSEREAQIFGVFLRDMMSYVLSLRDDEERYNLEMKDNPCFHRNYYEDPAATHVEWAQFTDVKKGHSKWEGRIYKAVRAGLDADEWMERRNTLLLLSQSYEAFPLVEKYSKPILSAVEALRDKEEFADLKTLANSVSAKLRTQRDRWVEKAEPKPDAKADAKGDAKGGEAKVEGRGDEKSERRSRAKDDAPKEDGNGAPVSHSRAGSRGRERGRDASPPPEKRSRRDADDVHKEGRERATKDVKEPKEARDTSDRKRGAERGATTVHEDRDKRRRGEREEPVSGHERYNARSHPRNALEPPPDRGAYRGDAGGGGRDYGRGGYTGSGRHGDRRR